MEKDEGDMFDNRKMLVKYESGQHGAWGVNPEERGIEELISSGIIILDKPQGPSSHQVTAWVKEIFGIDRAGHGGTLDPNVTGVLPIALGSATKVLDTLLVGTKEYVGIMQIHEDVEAARLFEVFEEFVGDIYQLPPMRAAVKREIRTRRIYELEILECEGRRVLFRVVCESGTYIRTLCHDIGEALGVGGHMEELRRTRTGSLEEEMAVTLQTVRDAYVLWKEENKPEILKTVLNPIEVLLSHLPAIVVRDSAVDSICHGADLAIPGTEKLDSNISKGDLVALLTANGEGIALGKALMTSMQIMDKDEGIAVDTQRVLMQHGTYPRMWPRDKKKEKE